MITCRSGEELVKLRAANQLVARILEELRCLVVPGATTAWIDAEAERLVRESGAQPAFKGYRGFPATICASRNHEVVHGIPSGEALVEGEHSKNNLPDVLARWAGRNGVECERPRTAQSFCVSKADIAAQGYDLSLSRYKEARHEAVEHQAPQEILAELAKLEEEIQRGMKELQAMLA